MEINRVIENIIDERNVNEEFIPDFRRELATEAWRLLRQKKSIKEIQRLLRGK